ncbi:acyltransferase family protein [Streptomyces sp. L7]
MASHGGLERGPGSLRRLPAGVGDRAGGVRALADHRAGCGSPTGRSAHRSCSRPCPGPSGSPWASRSCRCSSWPADTRPVAPGLGRGPTDARHTGWVGQRALRLLLPAGVYSGLVLVAVAICVAAGVDPGTLSLVGWAMAMQFWFLPVYLLLSAATPALHTAHRRWGLRVPVVMGAVALVADALVVTVHAPFVGLLNYVLVWGVAYQLGFCWRDTLLTERSALPGFMAAGGAVAFAGLVSSGPSR